MIVEYLSPPTHPVLIAVGCYAIFKVAMSVFLSLRFFVRVYVHSSAEKENIPKAGKWAVVTGSTGGIGREFVNELARLGMDIVLVSRSADKLNAVASEVENQFKVKTKVIQADAIEKESSAKVVEELQGLDIGILVNNVGVNTETGAAFLPDMTVDEMYRMINANTGPISVLTNGVLPAMLKKRKGYFINVSSSSGYIPIPYQALYAATKSYVNMLTRSVSQEVDASGIKLFYLYPQFVRTNMTMGSSLIHNAPFWTLDADIYVKSVLNHIGIEPAFAGYWTFESMIWLALTVPMTIALNINTVSAKLIIKFSRNIRNEIQNGKSNR